MVSDQIHHSVSYFSIQHFCIFVYIYLHTCISYLNKVYIHMVQKSKEPRKVFRVSSLILCPPPKQLLFKFLCTFPEFSYINTYILLAPFLHKRLCTMMPFCTFLLSLNNTLGDFSIFVHQELSHAFYQVKSRWVDVQ